MIFFDMQGMLEHIFTAKKVPLSFIKDIRGNLSLHVDDWNNVKDTVAPGETLQPFGYYAEYVLERFEPLTFL